MSWLSDLIGKEKIPVEVYRDLDALETTPVPFKVGGEVHVLNPLTTAQFYEFTKGLVQFQAAQQDSLTPNQIVDIYSGLITPLIPTLTRKKIGDLTIQQANAIFNMVMETVLGKNHVQGAEKKRP
jgi:hypothetical protein